MAEFVLSAGQDSGLTQVLKTCLQQVKIKIKKDTPNAHQKVRCLFTQQVEVARMGLERVKTLPARIQV